MSQRFDEAKGASFETLKERWQTATEAGRLEEAQAIIERALSWARESGDANQVDSAVCAFAAVAIQLGRGEGELPRLREILLRNSDPANCRLAAYNISAHYQLTKNYKKSLFYARIARDRSESLGRRDWIASSHNQIGNALLSESLVEEACREYEQALELMSNEPNVWRALILDNLGYCRVLQHRVSEGYALLYESLAILRRFGAERYQVSTRLDLCFAHLETGRYGHARRHGRMALRFAEATQQIDGIKNALYLLGEVESLTGHQAEAREHFRRLQGDFFPEAGYLPEFLLAVDVRKLVNLHA